MTHSGNSASSSEKWFYFRYVMKIEAAILLNILSMDYEKKWKVMNDSEAFGCGKWKHGVIIHWNKNGC